MGQKTKAKVDYSGPLTWGGDSTAFISHDFENIYKNDPCNIFECTKLKLDSKIKIWL